MELTKTIAKFIGETNCSHIPSQVLGHAKVCFLDWMAVTLAGKDDPLVLKLIKYTDFMGGYEQASILGHNMKKSVEQAALINGAASHALDYDDTLKSFLGHPSVTLFPSLLALSEWRGMSGIDFLTAYLIGLKTGSCIGQCAGIEHYMAGWHGTSTIGHLASAAGSARLLMLNTEKTVHALGIAGTQASGLRGVFGTMCKPFHAGRSSMAGLTSAMLAGEGFTSMEDILEGQNGFFQVLKGQINVDAVDTLGKTWEVEDMAQKFHASCHATHSPIEAALEITDRERLSPETVRSIRIHCSKLAINAAGKLKPSTGLEGKFSIPYCVANALLTDNTGMQAFTDEKVNDPRIKEFCKKITVIPTDDITELQAKVEIESDSGMIFSCNYDIMKEIPSYEVKEGKIKAKFMDLSGPVVGEEKASEVMSLILSLDGLEDIRELMSLTQDSA